MNHSTSITIGRPQRVILAFLFAHWERLSLPRKAATRQRRQESRAELTTESRPPPSFISPLRHRPSFQCVDKETFPLRVFRPNQMAIFFFTYYFQYRGYRYRKRKNRGMIAIGSEIPICVIVSSSQKFLSASDAPSRFCSFYWSIIGNYYQNRRTWRSHETHIVMRRSHQPRYCKSQPPFPGSLFQDSSWLLARNP